MEKMGNPPPKGGNVFLAGATTPPNFLKPTLQSESRKKPGLRLYLLFPMYLYFVLPTVSEGNESRVGEEERRCLAGGESKAAAGINSEIQLGYNCMRGVRGVRRRRPICAEAGRELPSLAGR